MRQIAEHAGVALGTLSLYARDKRDLALLLFNDCIASVSDAAEEAARQEEGFIDQLLAYFRVLNEFFMQDINISRAHLQLNYYRGGMHSEEYYSHRQRLFDFVEECVVNAQNNSVIATSITPSTAAKVFFFIYSASLRWFLATDKPDVETSISELRPLFELQMSGLAPHGESVPQKKSRRTGSFARRRGVRRVQELN